VRCIARIAGLLGLAGGRRASPTPSRAGRSSRTARES
jgi:hypothetical protein